MVVKVICIKDSVSIDWFGNRTLVKKGQIVFSDTEHYGYLKTLNNQHLGFFEMDDFIKLDKFREERINKILNND